MKWSSVRISKISTQIRGVSYSPRDVSNTPTENHLPIIRANNITERGLDYDDLVYIDKKRISETQLLKEGDIVIAASSGSKSVVGKASYFSNSWIGSFGAFCKVVRPTKDVCSKYLGYFFQSAEYRNIISHLSAGANINNIRNGDIDNLEILLPPMQIQKKVVNILDESQKLKRNDQQLIVKYDQLLRSVFHKMFNEKQKYGVNIKIKALEDVAIKITDGTHQSPKFIKKGIPFLLVSNIVDNEIVYETNKFINRKEYEVLIKRTPIELGDILLTSVGSYGNPAIVKSTQEFCFQRHIAYIKPNHEIIDSEFLFAALKSDYVRNQIDRKVKGVAQKTLNLADLKKIQLEVPDIKLQKEFSSIATLIHQQKQQAKQQLQKSENIYQCLLQKAFKGELII